MTEDLNGKLRKIADAYRKKVETESSMHDEFRRKWQRRSGEIKSVLANIAQRLGETPAVIGEWEEDGVILLRVLVDARTDDLRYRPNYAEINVDITTTARFSGGYAEETSKRSMVIDDLTDAVVADHAVAFLSKVLNV